jgi:hypothetical protein
MTRITRREIEANENLKMFDANDEYNLNLFCYTTCDDDTKEQIIKRCRGLIFDGDNLVMEAFPYTSIIKKDKKELISELNEKLKDCVCFESLEGTLIRMFYFRDRWFMSTNRKLDVYKSKWSYNETFGVLFEKSLNFMYNEDRAVRDALDKGEGESLLSKLQSLLDKENHYMFLLQSCRENRIVCDVSNPKIFHSGTFKKGTLYLDDIIPIPYSIRHRFENIDKIFEFVKNQDIKSVQGIIIFDTKNNLQYKVENDEYSNLSNLRGNEPSIKFRYIQLRIDSDKLSIFKNLYSEYIPKFEEYENRIYEICQKIYKAYVTRFIKREYIQVPKEEFYVLSKAHKWHLENKDNNKVDLNKIISIFNTEYASNINRMVKRQIMEIKGIKHQ